MKVSIIIPVLDDREYLDRLLDQIQNIRAGGHEIIVVDGGSQDGLPEVTQGRSDMVIHSQKGRGTQMNAGARQASGDILFFIHADTQLPSKFLQVIQDACRNSPSRWGFFRVKLSGEKWLFRLIETCMNFRSKLTSIATGDQCLFITKSLFIETGGYEEIPLMEDISLCRHLKAVCKPFVAEQTVTTSSRRWEQQGMVRTIIRMWFLRLAYFLGVKPGSLVRYYYG